MYKHLFYRHIFQVQITFMLQEQPFEVGQYDLTH